MKVKFSLNTRWLCYLTPFHTPEFQALIGDFGVDVVEEGHDVEFVQYEFTVDDPAVFSRTFSGRYPMNRSDLPLYEYACHEGNYGLYNILNGARADELTDEQGGGL